MSSTYSRSSPYFGTRTWGKFLDVWPGKYIEPNSSDAVYQIDNIYNLRPDLLAHDLYQDSSLWWVFAIRNPDVLSNPLFGFTTGKIIYIPTKATLQAQLDI